MTEAELVDLGITVHSSVFVLSLGAAYAVLGDKFVLPVVRRAEELCSLTRGDLSEQLIDQIKPFVNADVAVLGPDGRPATPELVSQVDSEAFKNSVSKFLDRNSTHFDDYWLASECRHGLLDSWSGMRMTAAIWPITALIIALVFGGWKLGLIPTASDFWMYALSTMFQLPLIVFVVNLPRFARHAVRLDRIRR